MSNTVYEVFKGVSLPDTERRYESIESSFLIIAPDLVDELEAMMPSFVRSLQIDNSLVSRFNNPVLSAEPLKRWMLETTDVGPDDPEKLLLKRERAVEIRKIFATLKPIEEIVVWAWINNGDVFNPALAKEIGLPIDKTREILRYALEKLGSRKRGIHTRKALQGYS